MAVSKLDTNSKMIISKYLSGKDFITFISTTPNLNTYYHTTFKYIIIPGFKKYLPNIFIKRIINNLQNFENLNEIVLNFKQLTNLLYNYKINYSIITMCNYIKQYINIPIKINVLNTNGNNYDFLLAQYNDLSEENFDFIIKHFKQPINILIDKNTNISHIIDKFKNNYEFVYTIDGNENIEYVFNMYKNLKRIHKDLNLCFAYNDMSVKYKINELTDFYKYFAISNFRNNIVGVKYPYHCAFLFVSQYINLFSDYYTILKLKHTDLSYLHNFITDSEHIINDIMNLNINIIYPDTNLKVIINFTKLYKYNIKNIYQDILDVNVVYDKIMIGSELKNEYKDIFKKHKYKKHYVEIKDLIENINELIMY